MTVPRRGEIYLVEFDPARGHEIQKTGPALVIQNDIGNKFSPVTIVAAISSKVSLVPFPVEVVIAPTRGNGLTLESTVKLGQIRSIDRTRLLRRMGVVDATNMLKIDEGLKISLGLVDF